MRDCPTIMQKGTETNKSPSECTDPIPVWNGHFYAVKANKEEYPVNMSVSYSFPFVVMIGFF